MFSNPNSQKARSMSLKKHKYVKEKPTITRATNGMFHLNQIDVKPC